MPFLFWCALSVGESFVTNFNVVFLVGQLLKDFLKLPRPPGSGKVVLWKDSF